MEARQRLSIGGGIAGGRVGVRELERGAQRSPGGLSRFDREQGQPS
jgi:hypothetical protein